MKLDNQEFKKFRELSAKLKKTGKLSPQEKEELEALGAKKAQGAGSKGFKPGNDFSWWNKYPVLIKGSANLPFNWFPGTSLLEVKNQGSKQAPVGAIRVGLQNLYGTEDEVTGPINMAARNLFLAMHRKYRGIGTYESADVAMVLIATIELISYVAKLERIYGVINKYNIINRNIPEALLRAMHISPALAQNIRNNLNDFRTGLNIRIMKAQNIVMPNDLSLIADKVSLYGYVYKDHDDPKAQAIVFDSPEIGIYDATTISTGGSVYFKVIGQEIMTTYDQLLAILDQAISALLDDSDVIKIYADMLAYLGPEKLITMLPVPENHSIQPEYSESILHKFHNATQPGVVIEQPSAKWSVTSQLFYKYMCPTAVCTSGIWDAQNRIVQHDGIVCTRTCLTDYSGDGVVDTVTIDGKSYYSKSFDTGQDYYVVGTTLSLYNDESVSILDTYRADPDEETVTEGVLWKVGIKKINATIANCKAYITKTCAFEGVITLESYGYDNATQTNYGANLYLNITEVVPNTSMTMAEYKLAFTNRLICTAAELGALDWAPLVYLHHFNTANEADQFASCTEDDSSSAFPVIGDIANARVCTIADMAPIHTAVCFSGFATSAAIIGADDKPNPNNKS